MACCDRSRISAGGSTKAGAGGAERPAGARGRDPRGGPRIRGRRGPGRGEISDLMQQEPEARHRGDDQPNGQEEDNVEPILTASPLFRIACERQWLARIEIERRHVDAPQVRHVPIIARATTIVVAMTSALKVNQSIVCSTTLWKRREAGLRGTPSAPWAAQKEAKVSAPTGRGQAGRRIKSRAADRGNQPAASRIAKSGQMFDRCGT